MATDTRSYVISTATDAAFRLWGSSWSASMQAGGLTKTSDTGQIDWATVTRPAINTMAGYEIFRLTTDTHHSTFPLYIKIEYGQGSVIGYMSWTIQTGSTTSGAGVLGGQLSTKRTFSSAATNSTSITYPTFSSGGDGYFCCAANWVAGNTTVHSLNNVIVLERLRDNSGTTTSNGVYFFAGGDGINNAYAQIIRSSGLASNFVVNHFGAFMPDQSGVVGSDVYVNVHQPIDRQLHNACLSNFFYYHSDITALTNITVPMYSTNRTFKPLGRNTLLNGAFSWHASNFGHQNSGFAILWE